MKPFYFSKQYWLRVAGNFVALWLIYTLANIVMGSEAPVFSKDQVNFRMTVNFIMALVFAYRNKLESTHKKTAVQTVVEKPTLNGFLGLFFLMLGIFLSVMVIFFLAGWGFYRLVRPTEHIPLANTLLRGALFIAVICFVYNVGLFMVWWWKYRQNLQQHKR